MDTITIDGKDYSMAALSPQARQLLQNIKFVDEEIHRHKNIVAVHTAARAAYSEHLKQELLTYPH